jgi:hypothetical protein
VKPLLAAIAARFSGIFAGFVALGCYDVQTVDPGHPSVPIVPDAAGWVDTPSNPLGITGFWYSFGDQYGDAKRCTDIGLHPADAGQHEDGQCSFVAWPAPLPTLAFPNSAGRMCTYGDVAMVTKCIEQIDHDWCVSDPKHDFSNMWGAGIALDFAHEKDDMSPYARKPWDAVADDVIGVAFDFEWTDPSVQETPFVRVNFPVALPESALLLAQDAVRLDGSVAEKGEMLPPGSPSDEHPSGSPFLDAPECWTGTGINGDPSGVVEGHNELVWSDVHGPPQIGDCPQKPQRAYEFDPRSLLGMQFQVPTLKEHRIPYGFCVSNLAFLRK